MIGFILTRQWRDTTDGVSLELWVSSDDGPVKLIVPSQKALCFIRQSDQHKVSQLLTHFPAVSIQPLTLNNFYGELVAGVYCFQQRQLREVCDLLKEHDIAFWESDIRPPERFLMERFITSSVEILPNHTLKKIDTYQHVTTTKIKPAEYKPIFRVASIDIETSMDAKDLYSIAIYTLSQSIVFMVDDQQSRKTFQEGELQIEWCINPRECLQKFLMWIDNYDPDILIGWHVVQFDCWVLSTLCERWQLPFTLGRAKQVPHWRVDSRDMDRSVGGAAEKTDTVLDKKRRYLQIPGRIVLDGIELLKTAFYQFDSFSLQSVSSQLLGDSKLLAHDDRGQAISDLFYSNNVQDKIALAKYNLHDCKLVWDIFEKAKLLEFAIARSRLTGLPLDKMGGSVASFEYAYLPKLHRHGYVAPNLGELESDIVSPGGYVMNSQPGLYQHVLVLDFKSLYPSIIRTFNIDPYAFWFADHQDLNKDDVIEGYNGAFFSRQSPILPKIIEELWQERDQAKIDNNQPLSQAIKIIMNSFYGVLGSTGCRFFDPRIASSITLRGHDIIQKSHAWIEGQGYQVIYGDTDSLFVWLGDDFNQQDNHDQQARAIGHGLSAGLNVWWQEYLQKKFAIHSELEIEFETHYQHFLMPTIRGSEKGSKKRYAGTIQKNGKQELVFKGLETVRADWTPLAKRFQRTLYEMIFNNEPYQHYIQSTVADVFSGLCDHEITYGKPLRRIVAGYEKTNPPHVKAAKKIEAVTQEKLSKGDYIEYIITTNGPEPIEYRQSPIDYQHYIDKQLKPIADSILCFLGDSFDGLIQKQMTLL